MRRPAWAVVLAAVLFLLPPLTLVCDATCLAEVPAVPAAVGTASGHCAGHGAEAPPGTIPAGDGCVHRHPGTPRLRHSDETRNSQIISAWTKMAAPAVPAWRSVEAGVNRTGMLLLSTVPRALSPLPFALRI